jgi:alpha-tubulin suppressor-like RCC1 family protein
MMPGQDGSPGGQTTATAVSVGSLSACAVTATGGVVCWGDNAFGELGNGSTARASAPPQLVPVPVKGLARGVTAVSVESENGGDGEFACAVTAGGGVMCWGNNAFGQLGNGTTTSSSVPVQVTGLASGATAVSPGYLATACATTAAGGVVCWGLYFNGDAIDAGVASLLTACGGVPCVPTPVPVMGLVSGVTALSIGGGSACAITTGGSVVCWGDNSAGKLGNGSTKPNSSTPVPVMGLSSGVTAISVGGGSACAVTAGGGVVCWGDNTVGELGNGSMTSSPVPVPVTGLATGAIAVSVGAYHSACAVTAGGGVVCWGENAFGVLGNGSTTNSSTPVPATGLTSGATAVSVGFHAACAVTAGGRVQCWGTDTAIVSKHGSLVPVPVAGF